MRNIFVLLLLTAAYYGVVFADELETGAEAYQKQDYSTAFKLFSQSTQQGNVMPNLI